MEEIISAFYSCITLNYIAVTAQINLRDNEVDNHIFYDCVQQETEHVTAQQSYFQNL